MNKYKILAFSGSLRKDSYNTAALKAAQEVCPEEAEIEIFSLENIPLYNFDIQDNMPEPAKEFKKAIEAADALLIASPEYNYSFSGVLKNAIDWATRPKENNSLAKKPAAILGASNGKFGTARGQYHLRQVLVAANVFTMNTPEVFITDSDNKFKDGVLTDQETKDRIKKQMTAFVEWIKIFKGEK